MNVLKISIVILILIMSVGAVCAAENITSHDIYDDNQEILETVPEDIPTDESSDILKTTKNDICTSNELSFTNLTDELKDKTSFDLNQNYKFNNLTDNKEGILIGMNNLVLNGNGHTLDANGESRIFNITGNNVTLKNLILINGNAKEFGAIITVGKLTLDNITFTNNYANEIGGAVGLINNTTLTINNSRFINNYAPSASSINVMNGKLNLYNTDVTSNIFSKRSQIILYNATGHIENSIFSNIVSSYAPAIYFEESHALNVINSKFINLKANITAGAIGVKNGEEICIKNCEFTNTTSSKNAGAIIADISGNSDSSGNVEIINTIFRNASSEFGGAYMQYGGKLIVNNSEFINNRATYNGGSIYLSFISDCEINNCNFISNAVDITSDYPTYGGAIFSDSSVLNINNSRFINNTASAGNAIYTYDTSYDINNSVFKNNKNALYTVFDIITNIGENNTFNGDTIITNKTFYETNVIGEGLRLTLLDNRTINISTIPASFDLRDYGWVSSVKNQGWMGSCWTFGMCGVLESSLLKATGIYTDFSENNMQNTMLRYSIYGGTGHEGAPNLQAVGYLLSWLGAFPQDADTYDELGKISPLITTDENVHVQDVMFTPNNQVPYGTQLKLAIMKYGSIDVSYNGQSTYDDTTPYYNPNTYSQYVNDSSVEPNHEVSIVGWDDKFPANKFGITPPGDGAWIVKNSWGDNWGDKGFLYVSYYDKTLLKSIDTTTYATSIIIENTEPYNKNYQYDIFWGNFTQRNGNVSYYNVFKAVDDDLIAAVGTYFNESNINYTVEIYINDKLRLTQTGISPYYGYHTIRLNEYIPIKKGDVFKAKITSNALPYTSFSETRVHYTENISFVCFDGENWEDCHNSGKIACLKVYTVADNSKIIKNKNITVYYGSESYFTVQVITAEGHAIGSGEAVNFTINGKITTAITNADGIAKVKITNVPGTYVVTTKYNGQTYNNKITVKLNPRTCKITQNKNINVDYAGGKYFTVKIVTFDGKVAASGVSVKFTINKKSTIVKTNKKGIAKIKITQPPKKYTMITTFNGKSVKNTVIVKHVLKATKAVIKKTAKKVTLKARLKINGKWVKNKWITFKFNGKNYKAKTNALGIAQKTWNKNFIKNLKKGKTYAVGVTYAKDTIKTTIKIK